MGNDYDAKTLAARSEVTDFKPKQDFDANEKFFEIIKEHLKEAMVVLDIGTGNGYVLSEIIKRNPIPLRLYGVDNSTRMIELAKRNLAEKATIIESSADCLPFEDGSFDLITAKNVTRINMGEVYRVLKKGGVFVFREYGRGKGLCEITKLFPGRIIRQREPQFYIDSACDAGLTMISFVHYMIVRRYRSPEELITIVQSFPFIENFGESDAELIIEKCRDAVVTSDPFIMVCRKE